MDMCSDETLIEEVRKHPLLYNLMSEDYKCLKKKDRAWKDVAAKIKLDEAQCRKRWKGLRDCYKRCKRNELLKSGSGAASPKRKWRYFETLSFLDNFTSCRSSIGNIPEDVCDFIPECNNPDLLSDPEMHGIDSAPSQAPSTSKRARKENNSEHFKQFLETASKSITRSCDAFVEQKSENNSTTLLFASLARKINEADMPKTETTKLESKVSALVFTEIQKFMESK